MHFPYPKYCNLFYHTAIKHKVQNFLLVIFANARYVNGVTMMSFVFAPCGGVAKSASQSMLSSGPFARPENLYIRAPSSKRKCRLFS